MVKKQPHNASCFSLHRGCVMESSAAACLWNLQANVLNELISDCLQSSALELSTHTTPVSLACICFMHNSNFIPDVSSRPSCIPISSSANAAGYKSNQSRFFRLEKEIARLGRVRILSESQVTNRNAVVFFWACFTEPGLLPPLRSRFPPFL